jgi:hypothetical protein
VNDCPYLLDVTGAGLGPYYVEVAPTGGTIGCDGLIFTLGEHLTVTAWTESVSSCSSSDVESVATSSGVENAPNCALTGEFTSWTLIAIIEGVYPVPTSQPVTLQVPPAG